ncbi:MAG TPA: class II aldolase/adducin family protein [Bryobacteraceae bacterium]|nr:class II aldolase/adducin family protein [Bryobacteraceae bacterium]
MSKTEREHCQDIVEVGRLMWQKGWVAAQDGNISVRLDDGRILCTPTGVSKGLMKPEDLIVCDAAGSKMEGATGCTTEIAMHVAIYRLRPDVRAVLHAHPPVATGFAVAGRPLNKALLPEAIIHLGTVPLAGYGLPGTTALTEPMLPLIPGHDALLMANHGAVAYGHDVYQAFFHMETVEHLARVTLVAELLGGAKALPRAEVAKLLDARARYGVQTPAGLNADVPLAAEDL